MMRAPPRLAEERLARGVRAAPRRARRGGIEAIQSSDRAGGAVSRAAPLVHRLEYVRWKHRRVHWSDAVPRAPRDPSRTPHITGRQSSSSVYLFPHHWCLHVGRNGNALSRPGPLRGQRGLVRLFLIGPSLEARAERPAEHDAHPASEPSGAWAPRAVPCRCRSGNSHECRAVSPSSVCRGRAHAKRSAEFRACRPRDSRSKADAVREPPKPRVRTRPRPPCASERCVRVSWRQRFRCAAEPLEAELFEPGLARPGQAA